jgi:hypothetical protein
VIAATEAERARVVSVNVGMPRDVLWQGRSVRTSIWKTPITGRVWAGRLCLKGDAQADLKGHGGEMRAIMVYQTEAYAFWANDLDRDDLSPGHFGENLTIDGLADTMVCIGDRFRIGGLTTLRCRRLWSNTNDLVSIFVFLKRVKLERATLSKKWPMVLSRFQSLRPVIVHDATDAAYLRFCFFTNPRASRPEIGSAVSRVTPWPCQQC